MESKKAAIMSQTIYLAFHSCVVTLYFELHSYRFIYDCAACTPSCHRGNSSTNRLKRAFRPCFCLPCEGKFWPVLVSLCHFPPSLWSTGERKDRQKHLLSRPHQNSFAQTLSKLWYVSSLSVLNTRCGSFAGLFWICWNDSFILYRTFCRFCVLVRIMKCLWQVCGQEMKADLFQQNLRPVRPKRKHVRS